MDCQRMRPDDDEVSPGLAEGFEQVREVDVERALVAHDPVGRTTRPGISERA